MIAQDANQPYDTKKEKQKQQPDTAAKWQEALVDHGVAPKSDVSLDVVLWTALQAHAHVY
eukprot:6466894-Amphidinium_carterae.1